MQSRPDHFAGLATAIGKKDEPRAWNGSFHSTVSTTIYDSPMRVEVRAVGLKAMREKKGLTQRQLAQDLGISQNYIPAIEGGARRPGPKLQEQMVRYFVYRFDDLFQVVLVDSETGRERLMGPAIKEQ